MTDPPARRWMERALRIATELGDERITAACLLQLGQLCLVEGRLDEASSLVRQSIELFQRTEQVDQEAIASLVLGRVFLQQESHEEAEVLPRSLAVLRPFALPRHSVPARSTPRRTPSTLTRRQLEVAGLVAQGLTNKEIASRLFISERTAEGHVDQICNKLGFNSRVQIAAWLIRREHDTSG